MTTPSYGRHSSAAQPPLTSICQDLRRRNSRRAGFARSRDMRIRIERALQVARQRALRERG